jgi:raffinose/stachyose/melibiose transport system substrate-binding protein
MKKRIFALTLAIIMPISALAACRNNDPSDDITDPEPTVATPSPTVIVTTPEPDLTVELHVLNYIDMTAPGAAEEIDYIWHAFENAYPDIRIIREDLFGEDFHAAVEERAITGTLPDVIYAWPSGPSAILHENNLLMDLTHLIEQDELTEYTPLALDPAAQIAGYPGVLPHSIVATHVFIINHEVLEEAGLETAISYYEMATNVRALRSAGFDTILMPNMSPSVMQDSLFSLIVGRFMGEGWEKQILDGETDFMDPSFLEALEFTRRMYNHGVLPRTTLEVEYDEGPELFAANTAAYYIDGEWCINYFITDRVTGEALISPERQLNFSVTVFPDIELAEIAIPSRSNSVMPGPGWGINADLTYGSPELEAAWTLVKWLTGLEVQTFRLRNGSISTPSRTDIDFRELDLEPLQMALVNLKHEFDFSTAVIINSFDSSIYTQLAENLQAMALWELTPKEVAELTQEAFEAWRDGE